ncbi:hypothetical protein HHI36_007124 [Cryptolaemus montrouzieri]|uniref:Major facilitator superfamily (MFS) profile domain-containing protein n=1 Tax=Cryptolaemus montrouzieri TaxID=559131 RepID=A0ABD2MNN2_9CUCU
MEKENEASTPINKVNFGKSDRTYQYLATISVCFAAVGAGTVLAWSSPALTELASSNGLNSNNVTAIDNSTIQNGSTIVLTKKEEALLGSILNLGALMFAIPVGYIADKFGRKMAIYSSAVTFLLGWLFIVIANNLEILLLGRFFGGMGLGAICVVFPMYVGEIAEHSIRATLSSYFQIFLSNGILLTFVIGALTDYVTMSVILSIFPLLLLVTFPFMPESHVHLAKIGKIKQAEKNLARFRGNKRNYDIQGEMEVIKAEINKGSESSSCSDIIMKKSSRRALTAVLGLLAFQQFCGINAITFYTEQIFEAAHTNVDPSTGAIVMSVLQCIGGFLAASVVERAGRKYFLILSSVGMLMGLFGLGMFFHFEKLNIRTSYFGFLPVCCAVMFIVAFTMGYGTVPYMLMHEMLSPEIRGIGSGMGIVLAWLSSFIVTYYFPISVVALGNYLTFYILAVINALAIVFAVIFVPETRGKSLLEIQELLEN